MTSLAPKTAIILINWNGAEDTIEALRSFTYKFTSEYIFILDNGSSDNSADRIQDYLEQSSINFIKYKEAENTSLETREDVRYYLLRSTPNRGFAGGNNFVIRLLWNDSSFQYFWLLNNDTIVLEDSLAGLIECIKSSPDVGFSGSVIMDYAQRHLIQCCGGKIYKYFGVAKMICKNQTVDQITDEKTKRADYQGGASLLASRQVIEKTGLLDESFFMYSEEADWQLRARKLGFKNKLALKSLIYHKGTVSTKNRRHLFYFYYNRASMILIRKHFNYLARLTAPVLLTLITLVRSWGSLKNFLFGLRGVVNGLQTKIEGGK